MKKSERARRRRTSSEGDILDDEDEDDTSMIRSLSDHHRNVKKSCQSVSTSDLSLRQYEQETDPHYKTLPIKPKNKYSSFRGVRALMNKLMNSNSGTVSKPGQSEGLVKGGLTPTLRRREVGAVDTAASRAKKVTSGEYETQERMVNCDSTSRPLRTKTMLQVLLPKWEHTPGTMGIYNHGNTCFINAVIQCLSNTDLFTEYFIKNDLQINKSALGKRLAFGITKTADVTEQLAVLIRSLWSGHYTAEVSDHFKNVVSKHNAQYKGSSQHDAQEFLLWLLDTINEELNSNSSKKKAKDMKALKEKPSTASSDAISALSQGCPLYNKFQALFQSSLTCAHCTKQSNTHESYFCLSLPVPQKSCRPVYINLVFLKDIPKQPKQLKIGKMCSTNDTVGDLREHLCKDMEISLQQLILCQIYDDGFRNTYGDEQPICDIHESETVYAFEAFLPDKVNQKSLEYEQIQILLVHVEKMSSPAKCFRFCSPQLIRLPRDVDYKTLQVEILQSMGDAIHEDILHSYTKLELLFKLRVVDGGATDCYLPTDVDMPLYTQAVERALSTYGEEYGPQHVKLVVEWSTVVKMRVVRYDDDPVEEHSTVHKVRLSQQQPTDISLDECFKLFTREEKLTGEDAWLCPHCGQQQQGTIKKFGLWSLPDVLVIHLKRFRQSGVRRTKLNNLIKFPLSALDMGKYVISTENQLETDSDLETSLTGDQYVYDLYGICNHYGNMNGGHYTAFCKNPVDGCWYQYDDHIVKTIESAEVVTKAAYILFYQRRKYSRAIVENLRFGKHWIFQLYGFSPVQESETVPENQMDRSSSKDRMSSQDHRVPTRQNIPEKSLVDEVDHWSEHTQNQKQNSIKNDHSSRTQFDLVVSGKSVIHSGVAKGDNYGNFERGSARGLGRNDPDSSQVFEKLVVRLESLSPDSERHSAQSELDSKNSVQNRYKHERHLSMPLTEHRNASEISRYLVSQDPSHDILNGKPPFHPNSSKVVLNNERNLQNQTLVSGERLVLQTNNFRLEKTTNFQRSDSIGPSSPSSKAGSGPESGTLSSKTARAQSDKVASHNSENNNSACHSDYINEHSQGIDTWSLSKQPHQSPSPEVNGKTHWLTPQPTRKIESGLTSRHAEIQRQLSNPSHSSSRLSRPPFPHQTENATSKSHDYDRHANISGRLKSYHPDLDQSSTDEHKYFRRHDHRRSTSATRRELPEPSGYATVGRVSRKPQTSEQYRRDETLFNSIGAPHDMLTQHHSVQLSLGANTSHSFHESAPHSEAVRKIHEPRSRAPLNYDPYRYQDHTTTDFPRYQPHMHTGKLISKLVMRHNQYSKDASCLKESSV
ncbi:hypothetical protein CHS0354_028312 [Potamilus streckersoni]|uniref:ubiquitinyl hydrolase 1 n=1 Tax=Potamilus streckersoni TaxID=2493646 RepID=A0AAE0VIG5_9BIVA|nr:hypothetical protein CHS0354_028312 [Potamilus streckersoni]